MSKKSTHKKAHAEYVPITSVKVVGVGGGGSNAIARMSRNFARGVEFIAINTDHQDLDHANVRRKIYIGKNLTRGLGTGMNPDLGRQAAEENRSEIAEALKGADIVFIAAGLGGGTGSGAGPVVAEAAKQAGALTIAVVTKPFAFEGTQRDRVAREAVVRLKEKVDAMVVVPNDRIFTVISKDTPVMKAFEAIDEVLRNSLNGIVELIMLPGIINVDFADVKAIVQDAGHAIIGVGLGTGPERAVNAVQAAMNSPLLEMGMEGAKAVLLGISGGRDLRMNEINDAAKIVAQVADPGARIIFGAYHDKDLKPNQVKVTLIATGFNNSQPGSLFGNGHGSEKRQSNFGGAAILEPGYGGEEKPAKSVFDPAAMKKPQQQFGKSERESIFEKDILSAPKREQSMSERPTAAESAKKEADMWDIPTFLRRRKK
ncbi:MAG TPA: cell division protein FtsZ [Candidatus Paceibacterota bacterium]|nr:cell division protein FtsZ [Candidatus Paceibacterota bacterium]